MVCPANGDTSHEWQQRLVFFEYDEGSSFNKALEITNLTGGVIDLSEYDVEIYFIGSTSAGTTIRPSGTLAHGASFVLADDGASAGILAVADQTSTANFFNGDDAVALVRRADRALIEVIGQIGVDPGSAWSSGGATTQNGTLRRKATILRGDTNGLDAFDPSIGMAFP